MITMSARQLSVAIILVIIYSNDYQKNMEIKKIEPMAANSLSCMHPFFGSCGVCVKGERNRSLSIFKTWSGFIYCTLCVMISMNSCNATSDFLLFVCAT